MSALATVREGRFQEKGKIKALEELRASESLIRTGLSTADQQSIHRIFTVYLRYFWGAGYGKSRAFRFETPEMLDHLSELSWHYMIDRKSITHL